MPEFIRYLFINSPGAKYFFGRSVALSSDKVIFTFGKSYMTSAVRKSTLEVPVPGSFCHKIRGKDGSDLVKPSGSNQVNIKEVQSKISLHSPTVY